MELACLPSLTDEIRDARNAGRTPRVHPNGFLQLDLEPDRMSTDRPIAKRRLHIFDDRLPRQSVRTSVHDHIFDMSSFVLKGTILNDTYVTVPDEEGDLEIHQAEAAKGMETNLVSTGHRCTLRLKHTEYVYMGESYRFPALTFHDSRHEGVAATIMTKGDTFPLKTPRVLVPVDAEPDNSFSREEQDIPALWTLIEDTFSFQL
jgi:hypothetical protein